MTLPSEDEVLVSLDATWPPAAFAPSGPFRLRQGAGGGKRVSAATAEGPVAEPDIAAAEAAMRAMGQTPLFMLRPEETAFDALLEARGYRVVDPVTLFAAPPAPATVPPGAPGWTPGLEALLDAGGIGSARRAVMDRASGAKAVLVLPGAEAPEAAVFVACGGGGAMLHALHVDPRARRRGLGRALARGALAWAAAAGAPWLALAVTDANAPACALYASLGFQPVGRYRYRASRG